MARFNDLVTGKLLSGCLDCLSRHGIDVADTSTQLDLAWVPGSFEIPLLAKRLASSSRYDVVITLGAVIRGIPPISMWWWPKSARVLPPWLARAVFP